MSPSGRWTVASETLVTLVLAVAGGVVAEALRIPVGFIMGSSLAVGIAGLCGVRVGMPNWLRDAAFVLTGVVLGTNVARESLQLLGQWPVTLAALVVELVIIIAGTGWVLRRVFRMDSGTAYLSSFPGHLSFVMGIAAAGIGNARQIMVIQVIRVMMLTIVVPIAAIFVPIGEYAGISRGEPMGWHTLAIIVAVCAVVGFVFTRLRIPAGYALGAMLTATAAKLGGMLEGTMPPVAMAVAFVMIGAVIGARFRGITMAEFRSAAAGGLVGTAIVFAAATFVSIVAAQFVDMPFGQIWIGLAPGALESMAAMGVALGFDPAFVAAHHVARLLLLTFAIPVIALLVRDKKPEPGAE